MSMVAVFTESESYALRYLWTRTDSTAVVDRMLRVSMNGGIMMN